MSAWIIVIAGAAIWLIGWNIPKPKNPDAPSLGKVLTVIGFCILAAGGFAGWQGPVTFGSTTIRPFSFAHFMEKSNAEAYAYSVANLQISSRPGPTWRGASEHTVACTVFNKGPKKVTNLKFRILKEDHTAVDVSVRGPFPPNTPTEVTFDLPDKAGHNYIKVNGVGTATLSGATF